MSSLLSMVQSDLDTLVASSISDSALYILLNRLKSVEHRQVVLDSADVLGHVCDLLLLVGNDESSSNSAKASPVQTAAACIVLEQVLHNHASERAWQIQWQQLQQQQRETDRKHHHQSSSTASSLGADALLEWHGALAMDALPVGKFELPEAELILSRCRDVVREYTEFFAQNRRSVRRGVCLMHVVIVIGMLLPWCNADLHLWNELLGTLLAVACRATSSIAAFERVCIIMTLMDIAVTVMADVDCKKKNGDSKLLVDLASATSMAAAVAREMDAARVAVAASRHVVMSWREEGLIVLSAALSVHEHHVRMLATPEFLLDPSQRQRAPKQEHQSGAAAWCWEVWLTLCARKDCVSSVAVLKVELGLKHVLSYYHLQSHAKVSELLYALSPQGQTASSSLCVVLPRKPMEFVFVTVKRFLLLRIGAHWKEHLATDELLRQCWLLVHTKDCTCNENKSESDDEEDDSVEFISVLFAEYFARPEFVLRLRPFVTETNHVCEWLQGVAVRVYGSFACRVSEWATSFFSALEFAEHKIPPVPLWDAMTEDVNDLHVMLWGNWAATGKQQDVVSDQDVLRGVHRDVAELVSMFVPETSAKLQCLGDFFGAVLLGLEASRVATVAPLSLVVSPSSEASDSNARAPLHSPNLSRRMRNMKVSRGIPRTPIMPRRPATRPQTGRPTRRPIVPSSPGSYEI